MTATALHPATAAALAASAQAHELAAAVLRTRKPMAAKAHADLATDFRTKAAGPAAVVAR